MDHEAGFNQIPGSEFSYEPSFNTILASNNHSAPAYNSDGGEDNAEPSLHQEPDSSIVIAAIENTPDSVEQDLREANNYLPMANVTRIMRKILPQHARVSEDAKELMQESVTEFVSFVTSEASHHCKSQQRKTVTADDLIWAMATLGFNNYVEPLALFLERYREAQARDRMAFILGDNSGLNQGSDNSQGDAPRHGQGPERVPMGLLPHESNDQGTIMAPRLLQSQMDPEPSSALHQATLDHGEANASGGSHGEPGSGLS